MILVVVAKCFFFSVCKVRIKSFGTRDDCFVINGALFRS